MCEQQSKRGTFTGLFPLRDICERTSTMKNNFWTCLPWRKWRGIPRCRTSTPSMKLRNGIYCTSWRGPRTLKLLKVRENASAGKCLSLCRDICARSRAEFCFMVIDIRCWLLAVLIVGMPFWASILWNVSHHDLTAFRLGVNKGRACVDFNTQIFVCTRLFTSLSPICLLKHQKTNYDSRWKEFYPNLLTSLRDGNRDGSPSIRQPATSAISTCHLVKDSAVWSKIKSNIK